MRLRNRPRQARVILQATSRPVILGLGPGLTFEMTTDEARRLALDLADAIVQLRRGGAS